MNMIAIECSTKICSVASFQDNVLFNLIETEETHSHSKNLPLLIQTIIKDFNETDKLGQLNIKIFDGLWSKPNSIFF